jgi:hypothetical protein
MLNEILFSPDPEDDYVYDQEPYADYGSPSTFLIPRTSWEISLHA